MIGHYWHVSQEIISSFKFCGFAIIRHTKIFRTLVPWGLASLCVVTYFVYSFQAEHHFWLRASQLLSLIPTTSQDLLQSGSFKQWHKCVSSNMEMSAFFLAVSLGSNVYCKWYKRKISERNEDSVTNFHWLMSA